MKPPKIVAEIGCNHKGDMDIAHEMIMMAAKFCKVDAVKFQKRNNREYLTEEQYNSPHPNPINSYGETYGKHREYLEFTLDQHKQLKAWCDEYEIEYGTSVWDVTSAREILSLDPVGIKVPSACNTNFPMLEVLCKEYNGEIHISFGMTTRKEEDEIIEFIDKHNRLNNLVIYSCTSGYPVAFEDICLYEIKRLIEKFGNKIKMVGFSGHHLGISADIAALTLGAEVIERHYTLDRTWKGTDHAASLEPDGLRRLARDANAVSKALTYKAEEILPVELEQRTKLKSKKSLENE
jgi:sialic acid synthase